MSVFDWFILISSLIGIVGYGIYKTKGTQDKDSFLKGNHNSKWWAVCLGVMATQASGITFISTPGPVSYTHLDVYKRQGNCPWLQTNIPR